MRTRAIAGATLVGLSLFSAGAQLVAGRAGDEQTGDDRGIFASQHADALGLSAGEASRAAGGAAAGVGAHADRRVRPGAAGGEGARAVARRRSRHVHPPGDARCLGAHPDAGGGQGVRRRTGRPMPTKSWSIACWRRRATASVRRGAGSTWRAMPTAPASKAIGRARTCGAIATT